jgi:hypothetical protein
MANDKPGFFEGIVGSNVDERSQYDAMIGQQVADSSPFASLGHALGQQAAGGLGTIGAGLIGGVMGRKEEGGFKQSFVNSAQAANDNLIASSAGITPEELRARRRIRKEVSAVDDGSFGARKAIAEQSARIANEEGAGSVLARSLQALDSVRIEEAEWDKLQASERREEDKNRRNEQKSFVDSTRTGWDSTGKPFSGYLGLGPKSGLPGLFTSDGQGNLIHKAFEDGFSLDDPNEAARRAKAGETLDVRVARITSTKEREAFRDKAATAMQGLRVTERVLSTLTELGDDAESIMSVGGDVVTFMAQAVGDFRGIVRAFGHTSAGYSQDSKIRNNLLNTIDEAGNKLVDMIELPEGVLEADAAAQIWRANIMEMAYMAARLAEPSNKGLSDNDIKNALQRITGGTTNPQIMMRRFMEMQGQASHDLDFRLSLLHGSLENPDGTYVSGDRIDRSLVGEGIGAYRAEKDRIMKKFGVTFDISGRAIFEENEAMGSDVQPGESIGVGEASAPGAESDEDFALRMRKRK